MVWAGLGGKELNIDDDVPGDFFPKNRRKDGGRSREQPKMTYPKSLRLAGKLCQGVQFATRKV